MNKRNWREYIPWRKVRLAAKAGRKPEHFKKGEDWYKPASTRWSKVEKREHHEEARNE